MKGCRALSADEIVRISDQFSGLFEHRDRAWFFFGIYTGFRVSEIVSLKLGDVMEDGRFRQYVKIDSKRMKSKSRAVILHKEAVRFMKIWVDQLVGFGVFDRDAFVFQSLRAGGMPLRREVVWRILRRVCRLAGVFDRVATHSMRKTFAAVNHSFFVNSAPGDALRLTGAALGHADLVCTERYLDSVGDFVDESVRSMPVFVRNQAGSDYGFGT